MFAYPEDLQHQWFVLEVLAAFAEFDAHGWLLWSVDRSPTRIRFFANCSDLFSWGTADCEPLEGMADVVLLRKAFEDCVAAVGPVGEAFGAELYCARRRKRRPQAAFFRNLFDKERDAIAPLFEACGPERDQ